MRCAAILLCITLVSVRASEQARAPVAASGYVGSAACAACHGKLSREFRESSMGRSLRAVDNLLKSELAPGAEIDTKGGSHAYRVYWEGSNLYQSESAREMENKIETASHQLTYVVGSGVNGYSFLLKRGNWLFEAPLSYYSRAKAWELSPGFDNFDAEFTRPASPSCLGCHVGRISGPPHANRSYNDQPFAETAIGCENCHGPGEAHVRERGSGKHQHVADASIVNPAKLPELLAENICLNCHQGNDIRVLQPEKSAGDFRPGTWLNDTTVILKVPLRPGQESRESDLLEHGFAMSLSKCYRVSQRMTCITCHAVHDSPAMTEKADYFRQKCLGCHSDASCALPLARRKPDDCVACHMPKRAVPTISHAALTNHRILRTPDQAYPDVAYRESGPETPGLIHVTRSPETGHNAIAPVVLLQAYRALLGTEPDLRGRYVELLEKLRTEQPHNALVLAAAGHDELQKGNPAGAQIAAQLLREAMDRGESGVDTSIDLADALRATGRNEDARRTLKQAIAREPYSTELRKSLISYYLKAQEFREAVGAMKEYLSVYPADARIRQLMSETELVEEH